MKLLTNRLFLQYHVKYFILKKTQIDSLTSSKLKEKEVSDLFNDINHNSI